ncbi:hypothetical protein CVD28_01900 [Bacillus sp. M6-12]|uniref:hypothetical protein n=1 Tax=Bacillus sp. M6-12 TaxID=2054166 RepID=UPI000C761484|nr:hypothetical protein [Bacillus sp. M6-12]PLS19185.1 hypothetical protein CVD28_01900 [Bacillus sp. M6-12]
MIQFSIQKGNVKKGNYVKLQNSSLLFDNIPILLRFVQTHSDIELEEKLELALELFSFPDGTIYVLNYIGKNRKVAIEDIERIAYHHIKEYVKGREWIKAFYHDKPKHIQELNDFLCLEPFGDYIAEVSEEEKVYEIILDLDKKEWIFCHKNQEKMCLSFDEIRGKHIEELTYNIYQNYMIIPLSSS